MKSHGFQLLFAALMLVARMSWAKEPPKPQPLGRQNTALTTQEKFLMQSTVVADAHVRQILGAGQPRFMVSEAQVDKYEALAYLHGDTDKLPTHRINVLTFNPQTNKAAHIFMSLEQNSILSVREIAPADVPLFPEEAAEALVLAKANPDVQRAVGSSLGQFVIPASNSDVGVPFAAHALRIHSVDSADPCTADRCLDLIFRTENGYLPLRAGVDLTKHMVVVRISPPGKGKHQ